MDEEQGIYPTRVYFPALTRSITDALHDMAAKDKKLFASEAPPAFAIVGWDQPPHDSPAFYAIDAEGRPCIHLRETFIQLLWCASYAMNVKHKATEVVLNLREATEADPEGETIGELVFKAGLLLMVDPDPTPHFALPNPEQPETRQSDIEAAQDAFEAAVAFTLLHEYGHHREGDLEGHEGENLMMEHRADAFAANTLKVLRDNDPDNSDAYASGVVSALLCLLVLNPEWKGGDQHPDPDERMNRVFDAVAEDDNDRLWFMGVVALYLWADTCGVPVPYVEDPRSYRNAFMLVSQGLRGNLGMM